MRAHGASTWSMMSHQLADRHLRLGFLGGPRCGWQLHYRNALSFNEARHEHDLAAGEFQRVMVHVPLVPIDLPEASDPRRNRAAAIAEQIVEFDIALEGEFCAR